MLTIDEIAITDIKQLMIEVVGEIMTPKDPKDIDTHLITVEEVIDVKTRCVC